MEFKETSELFPIGCKIRQYEFTGVVIGIIEYPDTKQCHVEINWKPPAEVVMDRLMGREQKNKYYPSPLQHPNNIDKVE